MTLQMFLISDHQLLLQIILMQIVEPNCQVVSPKSEVENQKRSLLRYHYSEDFISQRSGFALWYCQEKPLDIFLTSECFALSKLHHSLGYWLITSVSE